MGWVIGCLCVLISATTLLWIVHMQGLDLLGGGSFLTYFKANVERDEEMLFQLSRTGRFAAAGGTLWEGFIL